MTTYSITRKRWGGGEYEAPLEMTPDPGWAYCPKCNDLTDWQTNYANCSADGLCKGRSVLPIPTTLPR